MNVPISRFEETLQKAMKDLITQAVEEEIAEAKKRLDSRVPEITAKIGVTIQRVLNSIDNDAIIQIRVSPNFR